MGLLELLSKWSRWFYKSHTVFLKSMTLILWDDFSKADLPAAEHGAPGSQPWIPAWRFSGERTLRVVNEAVQFCEPLVLGHYPESR